MNNQAKIKQIETKIREIKSALTLWTQNIEKYNSALTEITSQLTNIKKTTNKKK
jgi:hypothetical protein